MSANVQDLKFWNGVETNKSTAFLSKCTHPCISGGGGETSPSTPKSRAVSMGRPDPVLIYMDLYFMGPTGLGLFA